MFIFFSRLLWWNFLGFLFDVWDKYWDDIPKATPMNARAQNYSLSWNITKFEKNTSSMSCRKVIKIFLHWKQGRKIQRKSTHKCTMEAKWKDREIFNQWYETEKNEGLQTLKELAQKRKKCKELTNRIYRIAKAEKSVDN